MSAQLILFTCPKCNRQLVWAAESATIYCKKCDRWITAKELKEKNPAKIHPEHDQMILF